MHVLLSVAILLVRFVMVLVSFSEFLCLLIFRCFRAVDCNASYQSAFRRSLIKTSAVANVTVTLQISCLVLPVLQRTSKHAT